MIEAVPDNPPMPPARTAMARESAAQRLARLRALSTLQRDGLAAHWQRIEAAFTRVDDALGRVRRLRKHPLALGLLAMSATGLLASRRGRRLAGMLRLGWRFGLRAATVVSLWRTVRTLASADPSRAPAHGARRPVAGAPAPRARAGARSNGQDDPPRSTTAAPDRRA